MKKSEKLLMGSSSSHYGKNHLRCFIQLALAGSILTTGIAAAALQDHGPSDPIINFPLWYRDSNNVPLQPCRSTATSPAGAGTMCFPLPPDPAPAFAGNIGPEAFYVNLNANVTTGTIDLRYVSALEAAYGTANPVGAPVKGQEVLFARTRFLMHVNTTDGSCAGTYRVIHPYGDETFTDVGEGKRALFSTLDVPIGVIGDFETVLNAPNMGPFLHWDDGAGAVAPDIAVGAERFVGDPTVEHTYTGSPFINPADGTPQNYVEVQGPVGCNVDGVGGNVMRISTGFLMGQVWTAPIPTATTVTNALFQRTATGSNIVDVTAKSAINQNMVVTGSGMPSVKMIEDKDATGVGLRNYFAHIEYDGTVPPSVTVTNLSSIPVLSKEHPTNDIIEITRSEYDPVTKTLCVNAHSLDQSPVPNEVTLNLAGPHGGQFSSNPCPASFGAAPNPLDLSYSTVLPNTGLQVTSTPLNILVQSSHLGSYAEDVVTLGGAPDNLAGAAVAVDDAFNVNTGVATNLNVLGNDLNVGAGTVAIISQPASGAVSLVAGTLTYTPAANTGAGTQSFTYVVQNGALVSNLAKVDLTVSFVAQPPTGNADNFAVQRNTGANNSFIANVLANDVAATGTVINPATVVITQQGTRGTATANLNGTVTYRPTLNAAAGTDFFMYTVSSQGGASTPVRVDVSVAAGAENISYSRNRFTAASGVWDLRLQENGAGWFGAPVTPTASCYLVSRNNVNLATPLFIGSASVGTNGLVLLTATAGTVTPSGSLVPSVPKGQNYAIQCATGNHVATFPSLTNTLNTPISSSTAI
jgi:Bacterial Ig domain